MEEPPHLTPAMEDEDDMDRTHTDAITELLAAAATALGRKRGKSTLMPHLYVIRSDQREKIDMGEVTLPEFLAHSAGWPRHRWCQPRESCT